MAGYGNGYGKRPWWFWVLVYVIIGAIVYYGVYYFAFANKGGYNSPTNQNQNSSPYSY